MELKYNCNIDNEIIVVNLKRLTNQLYKLLPTREENGDWEKPLTTIIEELAGMHRLIIGHQPQFFSLLCKLEGLFLLTEEKDFLVYRKTIFESLSLLKELMDLCPV